MYIAVILLTMLLLPAGSALIEHAAHPGASIVFLVGRWWVFWGVGVRLGLAGLRQFFQPAYTAREIFHMHGDEALPLVREVAAANIANAVVGLLSVTIPAFTLPIAVSTGIFYGIAGARHVAERDRSANETIAMVSDLFMALVLGGFVIATWISA